MNYAYERVGEQMQTYTLPNGLRIFYIPKPGYSKTFAMLATNFGSVDSSFTLENGVRIDTPAGVAHFLEHKMFEDADGNALQKFSATGASPNAFTSHNMTAYYFSCTSDFEKNLEILTSFVFTPYFTHENVEKEKGIIGQEISMMEDTPFWQAYVGVYQALYHEHPVHTSIAGSVDSIAKITPELLFECHKAFYSPANMALVVCGTANFDTILEIAKRYSPEESAHIAKRNYGTRQDKIAQSEVSRCMQVSQPYFIVGFKDIPVQQGESAQRRELVGDLCCRILAGQTSPLFAGLYDERLVNRQFYGNYNLHPEAACAMFGGDGRDPQAVRKRLQEEVTRLAAQGVNEELFTRLKRASYGMMLRVLDQPDSICRAQCAAAFQNEDFMNFPELYDSITREDIQQMMQRWAQPGRVGMSVILPRT